MDKSDRFMNVPAYLLLLCLSFGYAEAANKTVGWRTDGTGRYPDAKPPTGWSAEENIVWKTQMPQWSNASPSVVGDRLFVCAEPSTLLCVSLANGKILWQRSNDMADIVPAEEAEAVRANTAKANELRGKLNTLRRSLRKASGKLKKSPEDQAAKKEVAALKREEQAIAGELGELKKYLSPKKHSANGFSTPTPTSDGKRVYVLFGTGIAACYDLNGNRKWARLIERPKHKRGHSATPLLVGDKLLVHIVSLKGLDIETGDEVWSFDGKASWGSPVHAKIGGVDVVITSKGDIVRVSDGKPLARRLASLTYCAPIVHDGVAYFIQSGGKAIRLPETVTEPLETKVLWQTKPHKDRYYASPVYHDGLIYAVTQKRMWSVIDAKTGEVVYGKKLVLGSPKGRDGCAYSSVTLAGDILYVSGESGATLVLEPGREYKEVARNTLERLRSTPAFLGTRMYFRGMGKKKAPSHLYCVGE